MKAYQASRQECSEVCYHLYHILVPQMQLVLLVPLMPLVQVVQLNLLCLCIRQWYVHHGLNNFLAIILTFLFRKTAFKHTCRPLISVSLPGQKRKQIIPVFHTKYNVIIQYMPKKSYPNPPILPLSSFSSSTNLNLIWILS